MKRISVDWENSAEEWWHHAGRSRESMPAVAHPLIFDGPDDLTVSDEDATQIMAWAEQLPGWDGGPEYAPHPLTVHDAT